MDLNSTIEARTLPELIQGGMGVYVSGGPLAKAVAESGGLGVVSGTALNVVKARQLLDGDSDGSIRRALEHFPIPEMGKRVWREYFEGGKDPKKPFKSVPVVNHCPSKRAIELLIVANFVEVWLAKEGHDGLVGINYLEKIQTPHLYSLFGAILAGVDVVIVGAGLPTQFPEAIKRLWAFEEASYKLHVSNGPGFLMKFNPSTVMSRKDFLTLKVKQPACFGIVSTAAAARIYHKKSDKQFDGFVVELPVAGGHNAPPRGREKLFDELGQPIYHMEDEDNPGFEEIRDLGLPFWVAGGKCSPKALREALKDGASGLQIGTAFALSRESGLPSERKRQIITMGLDGTHVVRTDPDASPSGFPFKVATLPGTVSDKSVYEERPRICDLGYLQQAYWTDLDEENELTSKSKLAWRCPAGPIKDYLRRGGRIEDTVNRKCLCNALVAAIGLPQVRKDGFVEPAIITSGDNVSFLKHLKFGADGLYGAEQVIKYLLGE